MPNMVNNETYGTILSSSSSQQPGTSPAPPLPPRNLGRQGGVGWGRVGVGGGCHHLCDLLCDLLSRQRERLFIKWPESRFGFAGKRLNMGSAKLASDSVLKAPLDPHRETVHI